MKLLNFPDLDHVEACIETVLDHIYNSEHGDYYLELLFEGLLGIDEESESMERFKINEHIFMSLLLLRNLKKLPV